MRRIDMKLTCEELEANSDFIEDCRMNKPMSEADRKAAKAERDKERNRIASSESHRKAREAKKEQTNGR